MIDVIELPVVGTHVRKDAAELARIGDACELVPEPDNTYDQNAIKVMLIKPGSSWHVGYISRVHNEAILQAMSIGCKVSAEVSRVTKLPNLNIDIALNVTLTY